MKLFTDKKKLQKELKNIKNLSFVPTMGSLHKGHVSLIKKSVRESNKTLVSIYINPKQFENNKDYKNYPRNLDSDIKQLKRLKVNYLYKPSYKDIYKFKTKNKIFLDSFSKKLCGKFRKGHFKGVINVVNRFIEIIKPNKIFLGKKDFQQLILIKKHIINNKIKSKVISCKTIRNKYFVAYSSRLIKLNKNERNDLIKIIKCLKNYKKVLMTKNVKFNFPKIKNKLHLLGAKKIDYVEMIDLKTLSKPKRKKFNLFFAFYIGKIRFIDNF